jgi:hypothetical protein
MKITVEMPCDVDVKRIANEMYDTLYDTIEDYLPEDFNFEELDNFNYNAVLNAVIEELKNFKRRNED